mgnify:CR=1 FL=1
METRYACVQRYYNNGKVTAKIVSAVGKYANNYFKSLKNYDEYCDVFNDKKSAVAQKKEAEHI